MAQIQLAITGTAAQVDAGRLTITGESLIEKTISLPAGKAGTLTTRTGNAEGVITLTAEHGLGDGEHTVDIYWSGGRAYGVTATVATNALSFSATSGDNLPAAQTAVIVSEQVDSTNISFDAASATALFVSCVQRCRADFVATATSKGAVDLATAGAAFMWHNATGLTSPLETGTIDHVLCSNGTTTAATLYVIVGVDTVA